MPALIVRMVLGGCWFTICWWNFEYTLESNAHLGCNAGRIYELEIAH